jgi:hypothetical protein
MFDGRRLVVWLDKKIVHDFAMSRPEKDGVVEVRPMPPHKLRDSLSGIRACGHWCADQIHGS